MSNILDHLKAVKGFVFDVDGVLTDGSLIILPDGEQARTMNIKDGYALKLARDLNIPIAIISGGRSNWVKKRLEGLGIVDVYMGIDEKWDTLEEWLSINNLNASEIAYMGDDMPDIPCLKKVGLPCCPNDAIAEVQAVSKYISTYVGGSGCVRELLEKYIKLNGQWPQF